MKRLLGLIFALAVSAASLLGCGSSSPVALDREVTIDQLTYSVSSKWAEADDSPAWYVYRYYEVGDDEYVAVTYQDFSSGPNSTETFEDFKSWAVDSSDTLTVTDEFVIDGANATRFVITYDDWDGHRYGLHMVRGPIVVHIDLFCDDEALLDAIMDTIHLAG